MKQDPKSRHKRFKWMKHTEYYKRWFNSQFKKCGGMCPCCGVKMVLPKSGVIIKKRNLATTDHKVALFRKGTNRYSNLQIMCARCNSSKDTIEASSRNIKANSVRNFIPQEQYSQFMKLLDAISM